MTGHDTSAGYADHWLSQYFGPRLSDPKFAKDMLFIVTFDEADNLFGPNQIYTAFYGDSVIPGAKVAAKGRSLRGSENHRKCPRSRLFKSKRPRRFRDSRNLETMSELSFKKVVSQFKPVLDASLDCIAIVNEANLVVYANLAMKNFLGIKESSLKKGVGFCNLLKLHVCQKSCKILEAMKDQENFRTDESPATLNGEKMRVSLKAVPVLASQVGLEGDRTVGAVISLRNTTAEIILHAKYHKLFLVIENKDEQLVEMRNKLSAIRDTLRRQRK